MRAVITLLGGEKTLAQMAPGIMSDTDTDTYRDGIERDLAGADNEPGF